MNIVNKNSVDKIMDICKILFESKFNGKYTTKMLVNDPIKRTKRLCYKL